MARYEVGSDNKIPLEKQYLALALIGRSIYLVLLSLNRSQLTKYNISLMEKRIKEYTM